MNVFRENKLIYLVITFCFSLISCEKEQCYSQYFMEHTGYKKGTEIVNFRKYNNDLVLNDNRDSIQKLTLNGFQLIGSYLVKETNGNTDQLFLERVRSIGGYTYCY